MKELAGKVAVITGAASGIGRAMADTFGRQGMKVVIADVQQDALETAAGELSADGVEVLPVPTDVSREADVQALARQALDAFGGVHVVCNNAGVFAGGLCWESSVQDYEWVLGVNLWGVVHALRTFVPILLAQDSEAHIVNTASMAGVTNGPLSGVYSMSKHAVVSLSESLYHDLAMRQSKIGVSVLCPEAVNTGIGTSERNRPDKWRAVDQAPSPEREFVEQSLRDFTRKGVGPDVLAERVLQAVRDDRFYILAEGAWRRMCETRLEDVRLTRNPTYVVPVEEETTG